MIITLDILTLPYFIYLTIIYILILIYRISIKFLSRERKGIRPSRSVFENRLRLVYTYINTMEGTRVSFRIWKTSTFNRDVYNTNRHDLRSLFYSL